MDITIGSRVRRLPTDNAGPYADLIGTVHSINQELIRAALVAVESGARFDEPGIPARLREVVWRTTIDGLRYALIDHEDPDTGCPAAEGTECLAVVTARRILAVTP